MANGCSPRSLEDFLIGNGSFLGLATEFTGEFSLDFDFDLKDLPIVLDLR
jgi:hypothetical protein